MYLQNKYTKWYYNIINNAKDRLLPEDEYFENHHIIPESFFIRRSRNGPPGWLEGDPEVVENKVQLTPREHFICHWILTKMTTGIAKAKMLNAAWMMATNHNPSQKRYKINSRTYELLRKEWLNREITEETRKKIGAASKGRIQSAESRKKNSEANSGTNNAMYGKTHSLEARKKISEAAKGRASPNKGKKMSEETKEKLRQARKKQIITEETRKKISLANTGKVRSPEAKVRYSLARRRRSPDF